MMKVKETKSRQQQEQQKSSRNNNETQPHFEPEKQRQSVRERESVV